VLRDAQHRGRAIDPDSVELGLSARDRDRQPAGAATDVEEGAALECQLASDVLVRRARTVAAASASYRSA
jgi:hypothetical protein